MLDLLKLKTFQAVAATKNFTRAAAELGYSQSSVTTHVQALERELGALLFDRLSPRRLVLTDVGRRMLDYSARLLALADEAKAAVHSQTTPSGPLSVSAPEALLVYRLPDVLRRFQNLHPHVQLTLTSHSDCQSQIDAVLDGVLDLAFVVDERLLSGQLTARPLGTEEIVMVASPDYHFVNPSGDSLANLMEERVLLPGESCPFRQLFERALDAVHIRLRNTLTLASIEATKKCAVAGMGMAVMPKMAVALELESGRLAPAPWPGLGFPACVQMIRHRKRSASGALKALWDLAEQSF